MVHPRYQRRVDTKNAANEIVTVQGVVRKVLFLRISNKGKQEREWVSCICPT